MCLASSVVHHHHHSSSRAAFCFCHSAADDKPRLHPAAFPLAAPLPLRSLCDEFLWSVAPALKLIILGDDEMLIKTV